MCGITGFWNLNGSNRNDELQTIVTLMSEVLSHRGPDDSGIWTDVKTGLALGHRRLSVIDLSIDGRQPMTSACDRYVIVYNGEVYNFGEMRKELECLGHHFRGHSDTEVILASVAEWGLVSAVQKYIGMFAFALWDKKEHKLHLVRDRLGIKPLYYGKAGQNFVFASETKSIRQHPQFEPRQNKDALMMYFQYGYIPGPYSIYSDLKSLTPGCILTLNKKEASLGGFNPVPYWSAKSVAEMGKENPVQLGENEAAERLEELLVDSIKYRMISDVPIGAFLSGGIDSSTIAALMQHQNTSKIKTFTIGFHEKDYNEALYAKKIADHLGTEHTELYLSDADAMNVIPRIPQLYDEPFSDPSQIPTFLVSWLTRKEVTVALTGDGGDELFGGYTRYEKVGRDWNLRKNIPAMQRKAMAAGLRFMGKPGNNWLMAPALPILFAKGKNFSNMQERAAHRARALESDHFDDFYNNSVSIYPDLPRLLKHSSNLPTVFTDHSLKPAGLNNHIERMMFIDMLQYLPDDILVKVDRASMAVSLESRVPVIDHRIVEFAWQLPFNLKVHKGSSKYLLKKVLSKYIPHEMIDRPKMGFGVPVGKWIRDPLRDWAEDLLSSHSLNESDLFNTPLLRSKWKEHVDGVYDHEYMLWSVLMFQAWKNHWINS